MGTDTYRADGDRQPFRCGVFVLNSGNRDVDIVLYRLDILSDIHLGTVDEEVHVHEVIGASRAETKKIIKVGQALGTSAVGHCRSAELDGAVVWLHIFLIDCDALRRGQICLRRIIRLIRTV